MQHPLTLFLFLLLSACAPTTEATMPDPAALLQVTARCKDNPECQFTGQDLWIEIEVSNRQPQGVGFPQAYLQKTGPVVRLLDRRSSRSAHLKKNLADPALRDQLTTLAQGQSLRLDWVITAFELQQFGAPVDLDADIELPVTVLVDQRAVEFRGTHRLRIKAP